jgi:phosphate/sulfate permease
MNKYSKALGALVGSVVGILAAFNIEVAPQWQEVAQAAVLVIGPVIGAFFAPKNAD